MSLASSHTSWAAMVFIRHLVTPKGKLPMQDRTPWWCVSCDGDATLVFLHSGSPSLALVLGNTPCGVSRDLHCPFLPPRQGGLTLVLLHEREDE
jgi:hypothetical protein